MPHFIVMDSDKEIFTLQYIGETKLTDRLNAVEELYSVIGNREHIKVLIDVREMSNMMTEDEQEYFANYLSEKHNVENSKVAILHNEDKPNPNALIESFAYLNGYSMTPFTSEKEATLWLDGKLK